MFDLLLKTKSLVFYQSRFATRKDVCVDILFRNHCTVQMNINLKNSTGQERADNLQTEKETWDKRKPAAAIQCAESSSERTLSDAIGLLYAR